MPTGIEEAIALIVAGIGITASFTLSVMGELVKHPLISFAVVISVLLLDAGTNIFGGIVSGAFGLMGLPFVVSSLQIAVLGIIIPLCFLAVQLSARVNVSARR